MRAGRILRIAQEQADQLLSASQRSHEAATAEAAQLRDEAARLLAEATASHEAATRAEQQATERHADALEQAARRLEGVDEEMAATIAAARAEAEQLVEDAADQAALLMSTAATRADESSMLRSHQ